MNTFNNKSLDALLTRYSDDSEIISIIEQGLSSFKYYFDAIYQMESHIKLFGLKNSFQIKEFDTARSNYHNSLISYVRIFNRLCEKNGFPLVYSGTVSEEPPYRRKIADAVLEYVFYIVKERY